MPIYSKWRLLLSPVFTRNTNHAEMFEIALRISLDLYYLLHELEQLFFADEMAFGERG